jgi:hypothetical protein
LRKKGKEEELVRGRSNTDKASQNKEGRNDQNCTDKMIQVNCNFEKNKKVFWEQFVGVSLITLLLVGAVIVFFFACSR